jgi:hypothetical protein
MKLTGILPCRHTGNQTYPVVAEVVVVAVSLKQQLQLETQLTLTEKSADSGLIGLKRIPYNEMLIE